MFTGMSVLGENLVEDDDVKAERGALTGSGGF